MKIRTLTGLALSGVLLAALAAQTRGGPASPDGRTREKASLPAIYVEDGSNSGGRDVASDTALEAMQTLQKKGMRVVTIKEKADYTLKITRQLGKRSVRKDTKFVLSNREGEVVLTNSTRSVGGAVGDVVHYIRKHQQ